MTRARQLLLAVALAGAPSACGRDAFAQDTLAQAQALSSAIVDAVHDADDPAQGVAAAQLVLDERRPALSRDIGELRAIGSWRLSDAVQRRIAPDLLAALQPVEALRTELAAPAANDPTLDTALRKLVADYAHVLMTPADLD